MISAIVLSPSLRAASPVARAGEAVARSLAMLVRLAVDGFLRDVAIVGPAGFDLAELAEHAGCAFIETASARDGLRLAIERARAEILLVLEGGFAPQSGFADEAGDLLLEPGAFRGALLRLAPNSLATRLAPALSPPVGALAGRQASAKAAPKDLADLIRRLKIRRALNVRAQKLI
ncbi:transposase [uncultured Rhodoblastus sp.]|uniref:transposase n=1 Tax=uncultured Rhodoblastus sp. TaxID=543037 RepID=UPI0025CD22E7|nr:transposase [uncultured Rhodoblastus sp.]